MGIECTQPVLTATNIHYEIGERVELSHFDRIDAKFLIVGGPARQPKTAVLIARHDCAFQEEKWTETLP